mmetsp:Transcript_21588/g.66543  ORF Transcript_21588/g.66543 Transcript_21588/m.66543 type:complete len:302 (-) Transcript_21588:622-1527(-)
MLSLSSSSWLVWAAVCMTAVKKEAGLKRPESQVTIGTSEGDTVQSLSKARRCCRSRIHSASGRSEGYEILVQDAGTRSRASAACSASMLSVTVTSPRKPRLKFSSDDRISTTRAFTSSHSCKKTTWNGPPPRDCWSSARLCRSFSTSKSSSSLTCSSTSCNTASAALSRSPPPNADDESPAPPDPRSRMARHRRSDRSVRTPISAFGCMPKASGESSARNSLASTCSTTLSYDAEVCGAWNIIADLRPLLRDAPDCPPRKSPVSLFGNGHVAISSRTSSFMKKFKYSAHTRRSQSFVTQPP